MSTDITHDELVNQLSRYAVAIDGDDAPVTVTGRTIDVADEHLETRGQYALDVAVALLEGGYAFYGVHTEREMTFAVSGYTAPRAVRRVGTVRVGLCGKLNTLRVYVSEGRTFRMVNTDETGWGYASVSAPRDGHEIPPAPQANTIQRLNEKGYIPAAATTPDT